MAKHAFGKATLTAIHDRMPHLPAAQARVATIFLERPEEAISLSLADLAYEARSGEASVIRFCRTMGFDSLQELRSALSSDFVYRPAGAPHQPSGQAERLCQALRATTSRLTEDALNRVARAMKDAPHIDIFGSGVSGMGAALFAYRFSRAGLVARDFCDEIVADEIVASRKPGSVAMIVSETGLTLRTERFLTHAREAGAVTVAVCGQGADALAPLCDEILVASPLDPLPQRGELAPLVAKLMIADLLAARVGHLGPAPGNGKKMRRR